MFAMSFFFFCFISIFYLPLLTLHPLDDGDDVNIWSVELNQQKKVSMQEPQQGQVQGFTLNELVIQLSSEDNYGMC